MFKCCILALALLLFEAQWQTVASALQGTRVKRIVGGQHAKAPPPDDPVVFARIFNRDARVEGYHNTLTGIYSFLGLHYAEPPTGQLRYARPVYKRLAGDINATVHGPPCIQPHPHYANRIVGDENCLLLNVYTPHMPDESSGLPVYFWIHPGGFRIGSAAQYDATPMAQQGVIVVAAQYRLGSLGIIGDGTKEFDGNLAIFDMAAALRWVNDYISFFGGDPKRITPIGHGSGAASAMYLSMSRTARSAGDMHGVVAMSGTAISQYATDKEPVQSVHEVAKINGCSMANEIEIINCLRKKSAEEIIQNDSQVQTERLAGRAMVKGMSGSAGFVPHAESADDGRALPSLIEGDPEQQLRNASFVPVPLLTGVTKHETANAFTINSINKVFGSAEKFLNSLTGVIAELIGFLRVDAVTGEITKAVLPGLTGALTPTLQDVLRLPASLNLNQVLSKITESTTDILFNLPAVLTLQAWSQLAPAYMYSFEYNGTKSKGINFLHGLPIVSDQANANPEIVAHGDELGYLFNVNDIFGMPLPKAQLTSAEDVKVRRNFIGMLVQFAKGTTTTQKQGQGQGALGGLFQKSNGKSTPFIKVSGDIKLENDFRFCELSVLGAALTPLTSTTCEGLSALLTPLTDVLGGVGGAVGGLLNTTPLRPTRAPVRGGAGNSGGIGLLGGGGGSAEGGGLLGGGGGGTGGLLGGGGGSGGLLGGGGSGGLLGGGGNNILG